MLFLQTFSDLPRSSRKLSHCMPPQSVGREPPSFFPVDEKMAFIPASILGFQHMIAMLIGLSTPAAIMGTR